MQQDIAQQCASDEFTAQLLCGTSMHFHLSLIFIIMCIHIPAVDSCYKNK